MAPRLQPTQSPSGSTARRGRLRAITCAALVASAGACVRADPDPPQGEPIEMLAANAAARAALVDLRLSGSPTMRDYKVAEELLAVASHLTDSAAATIDQTQKNGGVAYQETIYRLYLEAATGADDVAAIRQIIAKLVQIDPNDTVSQLRLISAKISDYQTADARLGAYERFLGPDGDVFDDSVRSRLALDAALLLRERGDTDGFIDKLDQALRLDQTNKDAATLGMTFYAQRLADPAAMLDWKFCVLKADPLDISVYSSITEQLLSQGAFKGAYHFAQLHRKLCIVQGRTPSDSEETAFDLAEWNTSGADAVIRRMSDLVERARQQAIEQRKMAQEHGQPVEGLPKPEELRLPFARERMRIFCASALHDPERAAIFLNGLAELVSIRSEEAGDPLHRPRGVTEEQARTATRLAGAELAFLRLLAGVQLNDATGAVKDLVASGGLDAATLARLESWVALRSGDTDRANSLFRAASTSDPLAALGLGLLSELGNDHATAIVRYRDVAWRWPGTEAGAYAVTRYRALAGEWPHPGDLAEELEANAAAVPKWLDEIVDNPRRIMTLVATPVRKSQDISPLERTPVRVTLRNTSSIPLAMGPDGPLNTRLLFGPSIEVGTAKLPANEFGHVASLDRRLRLLPNESVDIVTFPDIGLLSHIAEIAMSKQSRIRWRVLQGFQLVDTKMYDAGPQCLTAELPTMLRRLPSRNDAVFGALQGALQSNPGPRELADVILSIKYQIASVANAMTLAEVDKLVEVIARRFPNLQRASKIIVLCLMPSQANLPPVTRIDQIVVQETDEEVLAVALCTRVIKKDDPLLTAPAVLKSPRLAALAQIVQDRLAAGAKTYATAAMEAPALVGGVAPAPAPEQPKPLNLDTAKPDNGSGQASPPPVDPPDTTPVPVLP